MQSWLQNQCLNSQSVKGQQIGDTMGAFAQIPLVSGLISKIIRCLQLCLHFFICLDFFNKEREKLHCWTLGTPWARITAHSVGGDGQPHRERYPCFSRPLTSPQPQLQQQRSATRSKKARPYPQNFDGLLPVDGHSSTVAAGLERSFTKY